MCVRFCVLVVVLYVFFVEHFLCFVARVLCIKFVCLRCLCFLGVVPVTSVVVFRLAAVAVVVQQPTSPNVVTLFFSMLVCVWLGN